MVGIGYWYFEICWYLIFVMFLLMRVYSGSCGVGIVGLGEVLV